MAGRMVVLWGDHPKVAPCSEHDFDRAYEVWSGVLGRKAKAASMVFQGAGYSRVEAIELIVLCDRKDRGKLVIVS